MANIIEQKNSIEQETRWLFHLDEAEHFWLRLDALDMYFGLKGYTQQTRSRLRSSDIFCSWWTVQCLIVEDRIQRNSPSDLYLSTDMYKNCIRLHMNLSHVQSSYEMIASKALKNCKNNLQSINNGR